MLYEGLRLKLIKDNTVLAKIIITEVIEDNKNFIAQDDSDAENSIEFRFLEKTNAWHIVFEGLGGEKCVKEKLPYTLCPM